jgi:hypothetical protein
MLQQSVHVQAIYTLFTLTFWPTEELTRMEYFNDPVSPLHTFFPCFVNLNSLRLRGFPTAKLAQKIAPETGRANWGRWVKTNKLEQNHSML